MKTVGAEKAAAVAAATNKDLYGRLAAAEATVKHANEKLSTAEP
jgi:hypothetical protein